MREVVKKVPEYVKELQNTQKKISTCKNLQNTQNMQKVTKYAGGNMLHIPKYSMTVGLIIMQ